MAESKFMAFLKSIFGGGPKTPQHERFCMGCRKITAGGLAPAAQGASMVFTCGECKHSTELLA